jgi:hypothetical protein
MARTTIVTGNTVDQPRSARTEADEFGAFVRRIIRAYARRVGDKDIEALTGLAALRDEVDAAIVEAVNNLHGDPYSWADIGRALGTTRQAAQMRFGKTDPR